MYFPSYRSAVLEYMYDKTKLLSHIDLSLNRASGLTDFLSITCSGTEEKVEGNYEQTSPRSSNEWHFVKITAKPGLDKVLAKENIFISFHFPYSYDRLPLQTRCSSGRTRRGWSGS